MRILHVIPSLRPETGGPSRSIPELCQALSEEGADIELATFRRPRAISTLDATVLFPVRFFTPLPGSSQFPSLSFLLWLRRELPRFDVVVLHALWSPAVTLTAAECRRLSVPYLLSPLGMLRRAATERKRWMKRAYWRIVERKTVQGAACIRFFNRMDAQESIEYVGSACPPHVEISNGINLTAFDKRPRMGFRSRYPALQERRVMLFVGRLHWSKNLRLQWEAFKVLATRHPNLMWVLAGPDEGEQAWLTREAKIVGLDQRMLITGLIPREQCADAMEEADVVIMTSHHEGHSTAMSEALAAGASLVLTTTVGFESPVEWGPLVVEPRIETVVDAVDSVLRDNSRRAAMNRAAREFAERTLSWSNVAKKFIAVCRDVSGRKC